MQRRPVSAAVHRSGRTSPVLPTHASIGAGPIYTSPPSMSPLSVSPPSMSPRSSVEARMALDGQRFGCTTRTRAIYVAERSTFGSDPATSLIPADMRQNYAPDMLDRAATPQLRPVTADVSLGRQSPTMPSDSRAATPTPVAADPAPRLTRWYKPHTLVTRYDVTVSFHGAQPRAPSRAVSARPVSRRAASASNRSARDGRVRAFAPRDLHATDGCAHLPPRDGGEGRPRGSPEAHGGANISEQRRGWHRHALQAIRMCHSDVAVSEWHDAPLPGRWSVRQD